MDAAPDFKVLADLAATCAIRSGHPTPPVMYVWHNGKSFETQDYFAHWGPTPYIRADLFAAQAAELERLRAALEFYADKDGWTQPPVKTRDGLISVEYENQASKIQRDRGAIARDALKGGTQ